MLIQTRKLISTEEYRHGLFIIAIFLYLFSIVAISGITQYSPDSWTFYELAKTFSGENFYQFNTYRSYFSHQQSAAMPLGYPAVLAVINTIFGWHPANASYFNALLAFCVFCLIKNIATQLKLPRLTSVALAASFVLYPGFVDEIVGGRAYPAAALLALAGFRILLDSTAFLRLLLGGILLGASVLMRFDFLFSSWILLMLVLWFQKRSPGAFAIANISFIIGLAPWIIYSLVFFSAFWISDNSWVAISAKGAYVLDFPAHADQTIFTDPFIWVRKIFKNIYKTYMVISNSSPTQPLLLLSLTPALLFCRKEHYFNNRTNIAVAVTGMSVAIIPYLVTGYADSRYFSFLFFGCTSLLLIFSGNHIPQQVREVISITAILMIVVIGSNSLINTIYFVYNYQSDVEEDKGFINIIGNCHESEHGYTYIFTGGARKIAFKYGALTGNKAAVLPSNFLRLDEKTRDDFFKMIAPYRIIDKLPPDNCAQSHK